LQSKPFVLLPALAAAAGVPAGAAAPGPPPVFLINPFRQEAGGLLRCGLADNMRIVKWIVDQLEGVAGPGTGHVLGVSPLYEDLCTGLPRGRFEGAVSTDAEAWRMELCLHKLHLARLPSALMEICDRYIARVAEIPHSGLVLLGNRFILFKFWQNLDVVIPQNIAQCGSVLGMIAIVPARERRQVFGIGCRLLDTWRMQGR
jgi:hypothetical protein